MSKTSLDVIVVEDDDSLKKDLVDFLNIKRLPTLGASDASQLFDYLDTYQPRIIIVDLLLPDMHGLEIIKSLRANDFIGGIIILTSLDKKDTIIEGYEVGADIFLTKQINLEVLEACIKRLIDRIGNQVDQQTSQIWYLDKTKRYLNFNNEKEIKLTGKEYQVLSLLFSEAGKTFSRSQLAGEASLTPEGERRIDSVISRLRRKVKEDLQEDIPIDQVYGMGYAFSDNALIKY